MDFKEAKEFIEIIYAEIEGGIPYQPDTETENAIKEIFKMSFKTDVRDCNCPNRWSDAVIKLALFFRNNEKFSVCNYRLRAGMVFVFDAVAYTNANLTDDIVERIRTERPEEFKYVDKVEPKNVSIPKKRRNKSNKTKKEENNSNDSIAETDKQ
jgi:hypothetical protein